MKSIIEMINKTFEIQLTEVAEPRGEIVGRIKSQYEPLLEHCIKAFVFRNTQDYDGYVDTISNILYYCNGQYAKIRSSKLKYSDYLELLFGVTNSYSVLDVRNQIWTFQLQKGRQYPTFERTDNFNRGFYIFYKDLANYFSKYMAEDRDVLANRKDKFETIVRDLIERGIQESSQSSKS